MYIIAVTCSHTHIRTDIGQTISHVRRTNKRFLEHVSAFLRLFHLQLGETSIKHKLLLFLPSFGRSNSWWARAAWYVCQFTCYSYDNILLIPVPSIRDNRFPVDCMLGMDKLLEITKKLRIPHRFTPCSGYNVLRAHIAITSTRFSICRFVKFVHEPDTHPDLPHKSDFTRRAMSNLSAPSVAISETALYIKTIQCSHALRSR